jgi:diguanylate cyclase (GGDEF)-like protein
VGHNEHERRAELVAVHSPKPHNWSQSISLAISRSDFMSATARETTNEKQRSRDQGRVLLVTDEPSIAAYGAALEQAGFMVVGVTGGAAALVSLSRTRPHIVIVDIDLRGISADELIKSLERVPDGVAVVFIGVAATTLARRSEAIAHGAFDYFQMPVELPLLIARTAQLVALRQTIARLRAEADRDYLTGLANRRRFRTAFGQELERWRRYRVPCALVLVDIDHLKKINDKHGHSAGDRVIRHIASSLMELSRDNDTAARLGGEEFALLLAGVDEEKALAAAERLRHAVCAVPVEDVGTVTISLGVAACPSHAATERTLYAASDAALYTAKREGRNRTAVAPVTDVS